MEEKNSMDKRRIVPPPFMKRMLIRFTNFGDEFNIVDDLGIIYRKNAESDGKFKADLWYIRQVICSLHSYKRTNSVWRLMMFKNFLKTAFRHIRKTKVYSFINVAGLALGLAVVILIFLWISDELSYDRFNVHADRIYRVVK